MNGGLRLRATVLVRARWKAAIVVGLLAGLGGGVVVALATAARQTARAVATYSDRLDTPDALTIICPPGAAPSDADAGCIGYNPRDEIVRLRAHPDVLRAGRLAPSPVFLRASGEWSPTFAYVALDDVGVFEQPRLEAGTVADPDDPSQVMINRTLARQRNLSVGDVIEVAPVSPEQFAGAQRLDAPTAVAIPARVTGIVVTPDDVESAADSPSMQIVQSGLVLGRGWVEAVGEDNFASYGLGVAMYLRPGADPAAVVRSVLPDRVASTGGSLWDLRAIRTAIDYEARAAYAASAVAAIAVAVFLLQLVGRQAARELDDGDPMRALGATRAFLVQTAIPRWTLSALTAAAAALATAALLNPLGPIGEGRQLVDQPGVALDPIVASVGVVTIAAVVLSAGLGATWRTARPAHARLRPLTRAALPGAGSPTAMAGLALAAPARRRPRVASAVTAVAVAVAAGVASWGVVASLSHLTDDPARFGASWDVSVAADLGPDLGDVLPALQAIPGIEAAAGLVGNDALLGDDDIYAYTFEPVEGLPAGIVPVVSRGRPPNAPGEAALGALTMEHAGVDLGDTVTLTYLGRPHELTVVGEALINDNYEELPGRGVIVDHEWLRSLDAQAPAGDILVRFEPDARRAGLAAVDEAFPDSSVGPVKQDGLRNLERIRRWPALLSALAIILAAATFVHALMVTARRHRRQLGVLRALGFSRRQVVAGVAWHAALLGGLAVVIGIPAGVGLGRWGWGRVAHSLGVPPVPIVPPGALLVVAVTGVAAAIVASLPIGWHAAVRNPLEALRAE